MLNELRIRDLAIIDSLDLTFGPGFNVLTGETGAGKSIIIDAVNLLLGDRASQEIVRAGAERTEVEGRFRSVLLWPPGWPLCWPNMDWKATRETRSSSRVRCASTVVLLHGSTDAR